MMTIELFEREQVISRLDAAVAAAETFFRAAGEDLRDGQQTAREALAHLDFWHLEYVHCAEALAAGRSCALRHGSSAELNALAARQVPDEPMPVLARRLSYRQKQLAKRLRQLPDWSVNFPVKADCKPCTVAERIVQIEAHIHGHVARLRKAARQPREGAASYTLGTVAAFALPGARHYVLPLATAYGDAPTSPGRRRPASADLP